MFERRKKIKIIIKVVISTAIFCLSFKSVNAATTPVALKLKNFSENVPILMYHYVELPPASTTLKGLYLDPKIFENQLQDLQKNNYKTIFVSDVATSITKQTKINSKTIVLSFDDGYEDFYVNVFPLLKKYNYKATLYVIINALDKPGYLTRAQVRELADSGIVEIASHTFNHHDLRTLKKKALEFEINKSKIILEQISGKPVTSFAYPFGYYNQDFFKIISYSGYTSAVSTMAGSKEGVDNRWILKRLRPDGRFGENFITWIKKWEKSNY